MEQQNQFTDTNSSKTAATGKNFLTRFLVKLKDKAALLQDTSSIAATTRTVTPMLALFSTGLKRKKKQRLNKRQQQEASAARFSERLFKK